MTFIVQTTRLRLREMTVNDLGFMAAMLAHPRVTQFYPENYSREETGQWIQRQIQRYRDDGHGLWLVVKANGEPVGQVGLVKQRVGDTLLPEIGYMIHFPFWRRGYAFEAASGVKSLSQSRFAYSKVVSLIRPKNLASIAVAEKLGMRREGHVLHAGLDHHVYQCTLNP